MMLSIAVVPSLITYPTPRSCSKCVLPGLATDPFSAVAEVSFGTKFCEGAKAKKKKKPHYRPFTFFSK
jgi:hypothetical protein